MFGFSEGDSLEEVTNFKLFQGFSVIFLYCFLLLFTENELFQAFEVGSDEF